MVNTDFRLRSMYADLEKATKGEDLKDKLVFAIDVINRSHWENIQKQPTVDLSLLRDLDPDPSPGTERRLMPVTDPFDDEKWGGVAQIDQDGNITMTK